MPASSIYLPGVYLPSFLEPQRKEEKKGHGAEFNCVNLPNPHPWHFCFRSQTPLVFLGVSVPLKDIIKPFFFPLKNVGPLGQFTFMSPLLGKLQLMCGGSGSLNTEHTSPVGTFIASWGLGLGFWDPEAISKPLVLGAALGCPSVI